jgi:hypothetical protein
MEMVNLHGGDYGLKEEDLERFIQSHPIKGLLLTSRNLVRRLERLEQRLIPEDERKVWNIVLVDSNRTRTYRNPN